MILINDELYCKKHNCDKRCLAGESAHHTNWYCPECDKERTDSMPLPEPPSIEPLSEWQPIETAPADGTWVLVYGGGTDDDDEPRKIAVAQYTNYLNGRSYDRFWWQFAWYDGGYYGRFNEPSHWMPLPEPPKANK